ncbi:MAG: LCP family protein [Anaerolineae bacterium]|nr:LCP family protein [Anaerolineae bacterium]
MLNQQKRSPRGAQIFFVSSLVLLFVVVASGVGYLLFGQIREMFANSDILPPIFPEQEDGESSLPPTISLQPWSGTERVNVLLMGIDERSNEQGPWRTDTMIILTIDPLNRTGGMLSIPRDLWVQIPTYGLDRINNANFYGEVYDYPGGGPALAMRTVQYNLGVPIHYYARINFNAFVEIVDMIGGIDVYVEEEIDDPLYPSSNPADPYGYEHLYIPAGMVHMDGELALKYARTRHSAGGDFDRAARQQHVMRAILEKITRLDLLPQLVPQAVPMWQTLSDSVVTDLTLDQIIGLAVLATEIPADSVRSAVISGPPYTQFYETPEGQQVLVPVREQIRELVDYIFTLDPTIPVDGEGDTAARLAEEAASVEVRNGTSTGGLAQSTVDYLEARGIAVTTFGNADRFDYTTSRIEVYTGKTFSAEAIAEMLGLPPTAVVPLPTAGATVDIRIILGADYQLPVGNE